MSIDQVDSSIPMWSSLFDDYFAELRTFIEQTAYPALINGPLRADPTVSAIPAELASIEKDILARRAIPVAMVGLTGVGKSTLLNALLEDEFLPVGVIGSQTAAFVTIRYSPEWEITCSYIDESELNQLFCEASTTANEATETGSPEIRDRAQKKLRVLYALKDADPLPPIDELSKGPPQRFLELVQSRQRRFTSADLWKDELNHHAKGSLWPVTTSIDVRGPFPMLRSGVVISDLPGAGDLNWARANRAAAAIKEAGQIIIAADNRLLQASLMEQLETSGRLPHRLFRDGEGVQIVIVGAGLDRSVPDPEDDASQVRELGLDPAVATKEDIFAAICREWAAQIRPLFESWLMNRANEFLGDLTESERTQRVAKVMNNVAVVPTSARDWRSHRRGKRMMFCRSSDDSGLPKLSALINGLALQQIETSVSALEKRVERLRTSVLEAIDRSETALGANIEEILGAVQSAQAAMMEVQDRRVQIVDDLRLNVLDRFLQIREVLEAKIEAAAAKMGEVGRNRVREHLRDVHWRSLRATVDREGIWHTNLGRMINLRDAMGGEVTMMVPQAWSRITEQLITIIENSRTRAVEEVEHFTGELETLVAENLSDAMTVATVTRLFDASRERAKLKVERSAQMVLDLLGSTSDNMQDKVDDAVQRSLSNVCEMCSDDAGSGWQSRSLTKIVEGTSIVASEAEARCKSIAEDAMAKLDASVKSYCKTATMEIEKVGRDIPNILVEAIQRSKLSSPQQQSQHLRLARDMMPSRPL